MHTMNELDYIQLPPVLDRILARTVELGFDMASEPRTGALLRALGASKPSGRFLELGTGTGIATAWLLAGMDSQSRLTSVDIDPQVQEVARQFLGGDERLTLVLEDGIQFLKHEQPESYDFVFADAMPGKYDGLQDCLRVVKPGGFYVIDDMLPQANWPDGHAAKIPVLVNALANEEGLTIVPITWASGIVVAVKRGNGAPGCGQTRSS
jgi:predicted O-methyltransferase YrrM